MAQQKHRGRPLVDRAAPRESRFPRRGELRLRFETTDEERAKRIRLPVLKFLTNQEASL